jgi:hypothetical protein
MIVVHWNAYDGQVWMKQPKLVTEFYLQGDMHGTITLPGEVAINSVYIKNASRHVDVGDVYIHTSQPYHGTISHGYRVTGFSIYLDESLQSRALAAHIKNDPTPMVETMTLGAWTFLLSV